MPFCEKCGAKMEEEAKFCPSCGAGVNGQQSQYSQQNTQSGNFQETINKYMQTEDNTSEFEQEDINQNKVMAVLAYIGILVLVPLLAAPNSKYARYHANQGLLLFIAEICLGVVMGIFILIPVLNIIIGILGGIVSLLFFVFAIIGIVNACQGKAKGLPIFGKFKILR